MDNCKKGKIKIDKKYVIIVIIFLLIVAGVIVSSKKEEEIINNNSNSKKEELSYDIIVEIKGEVSYPAIYTLPSNTRISDLIALAGGLTINADTTKLNLATKLSDGMIVNVPKKAYEEKKEKVNINKATLQELMSVNGIGEAKAQAIINYRNNYGEFKDIGELKNVPGISEALFNTIKEYITI